jgi:hypothetical protein
MRRNSSFILGQEDKDLVGEGVFTETDAEAGSTRLG